MKRLIAVLFVAVAPPLALSAMSDRYPEVSALRPAVALSMVQQVERTPQPETPRPRGPLVVPLATNEVKVVLQNVNTDERAEFHLTPRGHIRSEQVDALAYFFRCRRTGRQRPLSPAVLSLLVDIARKWPDRTIEVVSGYRAPPYGAAHSKHFLGYAIDLRVRGVRTAAVRDYVWRHHGGVGVGHYTGSDFVHVDARPDELDMAWSAREEDGSPDYMPRWASRRRFVGANIPLALR